MKTSTKTFAIADTAANADYLTNTSEPLGETMTLNVGPSHPATHGVLRLVLELDGEEIISCDPVVGHLHRGMEKIGETIQYNQFVPYTDRFDYLAPLSNNIAYACAGNCRPVDRPCAYWPWNFPAFPPTSWGWACTAWT